MALHGCIKQTNIVSFTTGQESQTSKPIYFQWFPKLDVIYVIHVGLFVILFTLSTGESATQTQVKSTF